MFAELYLTDGTTKIDLLGANRNGVGIALNSMRLSRAQREPSGAFRQAYGAVNESYELKITDRGHDAVAQRQQQLDRMLEQAANYFTSNVENGLVWLCARTADESNPRYAVVYGGTIESYGDVYNQPFAGGKVATINELTLGLERSTWQANPPLSPACVPLSTDVLYNPNLATWSSNRSITNVQSLFTTQAGSVLAASNLIDRTTNSGGSWTTEQTTGTANLRFWMFAQATSGRIWGVAGLTTGSAGSTSGIYYSDNDGGTWTQHTASVDFYSVVYRSSDDTLFFGGEGEIRYIQGSGSLSVLSTLPTGKVKAIALSVDNTVVFGDEYNVWRVPNNQLSLYLGLADDVGPFLSLLTVGDYLLLGSATYISISRDDGETFTTYWREWGIDAMYLMDSGAILASKSTTTSTYISYDGGFGWSAFATMAASPVRAFTELGDTYLFAAANNAAYRRVAVDAENYYGPRDYSCELPMYIANHRLQSNWTHLMVYDSSANSFTTLTPNDLDALMETNSSSLVFPSPIGTNDVFYIGIQTTAPDAGAFNNFYIHLTDLNYTVVFAFEYWNGSAWTAFTSSELRDNTSLLHRSGLVAWHNVALGSTAINSVTAYWVRLRVTSTGSLSTALPRFDNLYIVQQPFVEIDNIAGDIPALAQALLYNMIDDGNGNAPDLPTDKVIVGLRTVDRGERFTAFLNLAQSQNPPGVTVGVGTEAAFVTDRALAAAGTFARYTPVNLNIWSEQVGVDLDSDIASDFSGTFQVFLRYYYGSFADTVSVRLVLENITNRGRITGEAVSLEPVPTADITDLAYLGQFTIMPDRYFASTDASDGSSLSLEFKSSEAGGIYAVDCVELILIPSDEWIGEASDDNLLAQAGLESYIDLDSATFPKRVLRATTRQRGSELVTGILNTSATGVFSLQPGQKQRLWFLFSQLNEDDESQGSAWTLVHQIKMYHHARWVGLRGED